MTRVKMCGLRRMADMDAANALRPDYIGFVFAPGSRRCVGEKEAARLRAALAPGIQAVGVFVDEDPERVARLLREGVINLAQLHGHEDEAYLADLRRRTDRPLIQAFRIRSAEEIRRAERSSAEFLLTDAGAGDGRAFDWRLLEGLSRPFFLAGGLDPENVIAAMETVHPWGVDVSSGIETDGVKDPEKMRAFLQAVRKKDEA